MIYTPENTIEIGRPLNVFVNGVKVERAVYADTDIGLVKYAPLPLRVAEGKDYMHTEEMRGTVTVENAF